MGVVICKPFGFEAVSSHQSVRAFAEASAALGFPTLRFDYAGTGDSVDLAPDASQLATWTRDIGAAVRELQRRTGVTRVGLLGFRLGALLATLAASELEMVTALMLVAPILNGKRYLGELRTTEAAAAQRLGPETPGAAREAGANAAAPAPFEVSGFPLAAATIAALKEVELTSLSAPPVSDLLIIDRSDLPKARAWCEQMSVLGVRTHYQALPGFVEMTMRGPERTVIPEAMIAAMGEWLGRLQHRREQLPGPFRGSQHDRRRNFPESEVLQLAGDTGTLIERPVFFGSNPLLFGIVTEPPRGEIRRRGVILVNSGADYHVGPRRMHVSLARRWARHGYVVLRMDLAGLGDSGKHPGRPGNEPFPPDAVAGMRAAVELLRNRYNLRDVTVGGMCSGAYHSLRAAVEGLPVNRILMINPLNFFQEEALEPEAVQAWEIVQTPITYSGHVLSAQLWRRLLTGNVNIRRVVKIGLGKVSLGVRVKLRDMARRLHIPLARDLARDLAHIAARGVRIVFVFSRGDPGIGLLEFHSGASLEQLGERYCVRIVDGADHNLTRSGPRSKFEEVLSEELFARNA
jgi:alpha-beta hydrolase superfamily lysophospholipase